MKDCLVRKKPVKGVVLKREHKPVDGLTFSICFGSYGGFSLFFGRPTYFRLVLGWVSISIVGLDMENLVENLINRDKE